MSKDKRIVVRVTSDEHGSFSEYAKQSGSSLSNWVRSAIFYYSRVMGGFSTVSPNDGEVSSSATYTIIRPAASEKVEPEVKETQSFVTVIPRVVKGKSAQQPKTFVRNGKEVKVMFNSVLIAFDLPSDDTERVTFDKDGMSVYITADFSKSFGNVTVESK